MKKKKITTLDVMRKGYVVNRKNLQSITFLLQSKKP